MRDTVTANEEPHLGSHSAPPTLLQGLSEDEVRLCRARGQGNNVKLPTSRSYGQILRENLVTLINLILFALSGVLVTLLKSDHLRQHFSVIVGNTHPDGFARTILRKEQEQEMFETDILQVKACTGEYRPFSRVYPLANHAADACADASGRTCEACIRNGTWFWYVMGFPESRSDEPLSVAMYT
jgi:hypothetical protein